MVCAYPYRGSNGVHPCGRCMPCRIQKAREWSVRLVHELDYYESATFATLTYTDENLPMSADGLPTLEKQELQKFFKRLRRDVKKEIKYYACGEYGDRFGRPHYHAIILGIHPEKNAEDINSNWPYGHTLLGTVTYDSCRYVSDYLLKVKTGELADHLYRGAAPPFRVMSQKLGFKYIKANEERLMEDMGFTHKGIPMKMPRYYKDKLGLDKSCFMEDAIKQQEKEERRYQDYEIEDKWKELKQRGWQRNENILRKIALKQRDIKEEYYA